MMYLNFKNMINNLNNFSIYMSKLKYNSVRKLTFKSFQYKNVVGVLLKFH